MRPSGRIARIGAAFLLVAVLSSLATWYAVDRTGLLRNACEMGLPNLTRPEALEANVVGCRILGPEGRYFGTLATGFEASSFTSDDFEPLPPHVYGSGAWFHCPPSGCGDALNAKLEVNQLEKAGIECSIDSETGFAGLIVEGWVTSEVGEYGHLGQYPREFFASRIVEVFDPPTNAIDRYADAMSDVCAS
jgi:hypothetical protein